MLIIILGSLSNDNGDGNKNGKKAIGLDWQNDNFARASDIFVQFFAFAAWLHRETSYFYVLWRREHKATIFFLFSWTSIQSFRIQLQKKICHCFRIVWDWIKAIKFEAVRILFLSDVFVAVAVVVA